VKALEYRAMTIRCAGSQEHRLRQDIERLAGEIGERNCEYYPKLLEAAAFIEQSFEAAGYRPVRQEYEAQGQRFANIEVELLGQDYPQEILVVGAHYDTERGSPGATIMPQALRHSWRSHASLQINRSHGRYASSPSLMRSVRS
jgi:hypothetical protein